MLCDTALGTVHYKKGDIVTIDDSMAARWEKNKIAQAAKAGSNAKKTESEDPAPEDPSGNTESPEA